MIAKLNGEWLYVRNYRKTKMLTRGALSKIYQGGWFDVQVIILNNMDIE